MGLHRGHVRRAVAAMALVGAALAISPAGPAAAARPAERVSTTTLAAAGVGSAGGMVRAAAAGPTASALAISVTIRARNSGSCINAPGTDGGIVIQLNCSAGWGNQLWNITEVVGIPGLYQIVNVATGRCLEIAGWSSQNAAAAMTWTCHGGTNQLWWVTRRSDGYWQFQNRNSGLCLDVRDTIDWIGIYQWGCHGGGEQNWSLA